MDALKAVCEDLLLCRTLYVAFASAWISICIGAHAWWCRFNNKDK